MDVLIFIVTTSGLVVAGYIGWRQVARPALDYEVTYNSPLLGPRAELGGAVIVNTDWGNPPDPHVFAIKLGNYGRAPIRPEDFHEAIRIQFGDAYLLEGLVSDGNPDDLAPELDEVDLDERGLDRAVEIQPLLLNAGDWFEIQAYTNGSVDHFAVRGRIVGINRMRDRAVYRARRGRVLNVVGPVVFAALILWLGWLAQVSGSALELEQIWPYVLVGIVGTAIGTYVGRRLQTG